MTFMNRTHFNLTDVKQNKGTCKNVIKSAKAVTMTSLAQFLLDSCIQCNGR